MPPKARLKGTSRKKAPTYNEGEDVEDGVGTVFQGVDGVPQVQFLSPRKDRSTAACFPSMPPPPVALLAAASLDSAPLRSHHNFRLGDEDAHSLPEIDMPDTIVQPDLPLPQTTDNARSASNHTAAQTTKVNNTIQPHQYMQEFLSWAQRLLNVFRARETDPLIGKPCTLCPALSAVIESISLPHQYDSPFQPVTSKFTTSYEPLNSAFDTDHDARPASKPLAMYRCESCFNLPPLCQNCIVTAHTWNPFHRVKFWNGSFFEPVALADLGLIIQLGHHGATCPTTQGLKNSVPKSLEVVHTNGLHSAKLHYCGCPPDVDSFTERPLQLWNIGLYPGSFKRPKTVYTLDVLKYFDRLSLQAKTTAQDFFGTLRRLTNHAFGFRVKDRYREFMTAYREFAYLQALKRFGLDSAVKLVARSLAVLCPACPQPGINMDPGWETRPKKDRFQDAMHYCKDGNFVICQHAKKLDALDFALTDGAMYTPDNQKYADYVEFMKTDDEAQRPTEICSNFKAGTGKSRYSGKLKSGQVGLSCSRHGFVLPCGTVDLERGESYGPVDFATIFALIPWLILLLLFSSYDINCKYGINWFTRLANFMVFMPGLNVIWPTIRRCIPKWHANAHSGICRWVNSFYFMPGVGQTDGEEPERKWAVMNLLARAVREMTSGHRQDILNHHYADYNIQKLFRLAKTLAERYSAALTASKQNSRELEEFEETLRKNNLPLSQWKEEERIFLEQMMDDAVDQKDIKNPYQPPPDTAPSLKKVRDMLAAEEKARTRGQKRKQVDMEAAEEVSEELRLMQLFLDALDIEHNQRAILEHLREAQTRADSNEEDELPVPPVVTRLRRSLKPKIALWFETHAKLFGRIFDALHTTNPKLSSEVPVRDLDSEPEDEVLPIPHVLPACLRSHPLLAQAVDVERKMLRAQASDALREVRQKTGLHAFLWKKTAGTFGQEAKTRNQKTFKDVKDKIEAARLEYERARLSLYKIAEESDQSNYPPLSAADCQELTMYHHQEKPGMKSKTISWFWRDGPALGEDVDTYTLEAMRIEWFRASARSMRWREEVLLLEAEMRRTQRYYQHQHETWLEKSKASTSGLIERGKAAYAARQAAMWADLLKEARTKFPLTAHV